MELDELQRLVGKNIQKARWIRGLTQEQVNGITLRYYQELERGKRNPTLATLLNLAEQFEVSVADLVNVPGGRPAKIKLEDRKATAPKAGRKPKGHPRAR